MSAIGDKLKAILAKYKINLEITEPAAPRTFLATAKLVDGSEIHTTAEKFEVGVDCFFKDAEEKEFSVPNGNYELEDGTKIAVADGVITEVTPGEPAEDAAALKEEITSLKSAITELQTTAEADITLLTTERDALKVKLAEVTARAEKLGKMVPAKPGAVILKEPKKPLTEKEVRLAKIRQAIESSN